MPSVAPITFVLCAGALGVAVLGSAVAFGILFGLALTLEIYLGFQRAQGDQ